jgi:NTP pyrophosphatase (non-canonical NTP hydrolase)
METPSNKQIAYSLLSSNNSIEYTRRKLIEECAELIQALIKADTKYDTGRPRAYVEDDVYKEMGDVIIRVNSLIECTNTENIVLSHMENKFTDIIRYYKEGYKEF